MPQLSKPLCNYAEGEYSATPLTDVTIDNSPNKGLLNDWLFKANMPTARFFLTSSVVDRIIYAIGGDNGSNLSTVQALPVVMSDVYYTTDDTVVSVNEVPNPTAILYTEPFDLPIPAVLRFTAIPRV